MTNHLLKRGSRYYIRRKIPLDLQAHYEGRKEIVKALGTSDAARARILVREESVRLDREFDGVRAALSTPAAAPQQIPDMITDPDTGETLWTGKYLTWIPPVARAGTHFEMPDHSQGAELDAEEEARKARAYRRKLKEARRFQAVAAAMWNAGITAPVSVEPVAESSEVLTLAAEVESGKGSSSGHLAALVEQWAKERKPDNQSVSIMNKVVLRFYEHVGRIPVGAITKAHVIDFKNKLLEAGQTAINTDKQLTMLSTLLNFASDNLQATGNAAKGVKVGERKNAKAARLPFDLPSLQSIFASPVYTEGFRPEGTAWDTEAAYWFPLIALYSGARLEEIAQLAPDDVYEETYYPDQDDDTVETAWVFRFTNAGEGQGVKTESSVRRIPIHPVLIARGFVSLAASRKGKPRIFSMALDGRGREGANWGKWFGKYLRGICKVTDPRMSFHSFRHNFKDTCRARKITEEVHDALTGHASGKVSRKVYGGLSYPLAPLVDAMARYRVQGLTLPPTP
ncbi:DUF6538 domain-containing protein [Paraburkholderia graminis]|uniref:DUF6538 domain-containing protein n=1 Tax=Paraburkholderia graminis TaxID=60548 RepID=UPI0038B84752